MITEEAAGGVAINVIERKIGMDNTIRIKHKNNIPLTKEELDYLVKKLDWYNIFIGDTTMKEQLKKHRFTVLVHCFATFDEAREYVQQLVDVGKCKVLPKIWECNGKIKGWSWQPYVDEEGQLRFV